MGGERLAVVVADNRVLDVPLRERTSVVVGMPGCEPLEVLGGQRVQPGQPVGPGDPDDAAVGQVDEPVAALEGAAARR